MAYKRRMRMSRRTLKTEAPSRKKQIAKGKKLIAKGKHIVTNALPISRRKKALIHKKIKKKARVETRKAKRGYA